MAGVRRAGGARRREVQAWARRSSPGCEGRIPFGGPDTTDPLAFKVYQPDRLVLGKRMEEHLRIGVCLWHSFAWDGRDMFGVGTLDRPWLDPAADPMAARPRMKMAAAFEFLAKLGVPYYCFHDRDVAPEGASASPSSSANLDALADDAAGYQERTGVRLLWGTANLFTHPRYQAGAATNPDPEVFAYAAAQVKHMLEVTQRLGGTNYVLWGGREGYDTLLNTDLRREGEQLARFLHLVAEHKAQDRLRGHAPHRAQADGADQAPVRPRHARPSTASSSATAWTASTGSTSRRTTRRSRAQLPPRGGLRDRERHVRLHRRQPGRPPERLGHRPVPELGRRPRDAAVRDPARRRLHDRRLQLRRQAAAPEHRPDRPVPRPHRRHRHARPGAARRRRRSSRRGPSRRWSRSATPAGAATLGAAILAGERQPRRPRTRASLAGEIDPRPVSGAPGASTRTSSTGASGAAG